MSSAAYRTGHSPGANSATSGSKFDIIAWYPHYQSCLRYFLDVAQHSYPCQALAAFLNIRLPYQRSPATQEYMNLPPSSPAHPRTQLWISIVPYLRRLVATGFDQPGIMHGWFGDDWSLGIGPMHESERRNFLFAAKAGGWTSVKQDYDRVIEESIPFLRPLEGIADGEIESAENSWGSWLEMEDWMLGPRSPGINQPSVPGTPAGKGRRGGGGGPSE